MNRGLRLGLCFGVVAVWGVMAPSVHAQTLGGLRLRVDPAFFEYSQQTSSSREFDLGVESSTVAFGFFPSGVALGIGGAPSNNFNIGVNVLLAIASTTSKVVGDDAPSDVEPTESDQTNISLLGYGEYVSGGEAARGFVGLNLGVGTATVTKNDGESASGAVVTVGASAGAHYFLNQYVSLDPQVRFLYSRGDVASVEVSGFSLAFVLGFSAWLGNTASTESEETRGSGSRGGVEGDVWATRRPARSPSLGRSSWESATTITSAINIGTTRVDLMGDAAHPDLIALRFVRVVPTHRAPTIRCDSWFVVAGDRRIEVPGAVYKGEPSGPGIEESLKSHVPLDVLYALAPTDGPSGAVTGALDVCGERIPLNVSARTRLGAFLQRFEKLLERNGATHRAAEATEPSEEATEPSEPVPAPEDPPASDATSSPVAIPAP